MVLCCSAQDVLPELYRGHDALLFTSRYEAWGTQRRNRVHAQGISGPSAQRLRLVWYGSAQWFHDRQIT